MWYQFFDIFDISCTAQSVFRNVTYVFKKNVFSPIAEYSVYNFYIGIPHFIALHGYCIFLKIEGLWQPCIEQVYQRQKDYDSVRVKVVDSIFFSNKAFLN